MKTLRPALTLASLLVCAAATAPAQTASHLGTNTFDDASSISLVPPNAYSLFGTNVGTYGVTGGRLEYSTSTTAGNYSRVVILNSGANSAYNDDWTASLTLTNLALPVSGYNLLSLQVFAANAEYGFFNIGLYRHSNGLVGIRYEKSTNTDGTLSGYPLNFGSELWSQSDLSEVLVRISHDSNTRNLTFAYSLDNGTTYQATTVMNPNNIDLGPAWYSTPSNGYSFRILARNTAGTVDAATMYADNFSVTSGATAMVAVPEPSTYAACAGAAALGLAFWHRRRQARRAS
jgi:hypothetical protein